MNLDLALLTFTKSTEFVVATVVVVTVGRSHDRLGFNHQRSASDQNRQAIELIESKMFTQTRRQVQAAGPAWVWGPEDRSDIET